MLRNPDITETYWANLKEKTKKILQAKGISLLGTDIDEAVDFIMEPLVSPIAMLRGSNENLVTYRDKYLLYAVCGKKQLCESETINLSDQWFFTGEQNFFKVAIRSEEKKRELEKYISIGPRAKASKNELSISCSRFCCNAKQLLAFKCAGLRRDAQKKRHSLCWLALRTNPPKEIYLEDYWYYEQQTGINLSVEIAALLDELFAEYGSTDSVYSNWDEVLKIICKCIEENYCDIAHVPFIDWKINVMKIACTTIVEELVGALRGNFETKLMPLAHNVFDIGMFSTHRAGSAFKNQPDMREFASNLLKQKFSAAFNQILFSSIIDSFAVDPLSVNEASLEKFIDALEQSNKRLKESIAKGETDVVKNKICAGYQMSSDKRSMLVFCDSESSFVIPYLDEIDTFIQHNELFDKESDKLEIQELADAKMPRTAQSNQFNMIHQAVGKAIAESDCHAANKK